MRARLWLAVTLACGLPALAPASNGVITYHNSNLRHGAYTIHALTQAAAATMHPDTRFNAALTEGRIPHREVLDGALVIFGGALLLTPGFVTDVLGIILLLPPTRALVRGLVARRLLPRIVISRFGAPAAAAAGGPRSGGGRRRPGGGADVEGTATEVDPPRLQ